MRFVPARCCARALRRFDRAVLKGRVDRSRRTLERELDARGSIGMRHHPSIERIRRPQLLDEDRDLLRIIDHGG